MAGEQADGVVPVTAATAKEFEDLSRVLQLAQAQAELAQTRAQAIADQRTAILRTAMRELSVPDGWRYDPAQSGFVPTE